MSVRSAQRVRDFILRFACASEMSISGRVYIYRNGKYLSFASFFGITIIYKNIMSMGFCCKRLVAIQLHLFHNSNHFWLIYSITMESFLFYDSFPIRLSGNSFLSFQIYLFYGPTYAYCSIWKRCSFMKFNIHLECILNIRNDSIKYFRPLFMHSQFQISYADFRNLAHIQSVLHVTTKCSQVTFLSNFFFHRQSVDIHRKLSEQLNICDE